MAGKKITELTQVNAVADTDLFIVETNDGTKAVPYSGFKSNVDCNHTGDGSNSIVLGKISTANGSNSISIGYANDGNVTGCISIGCMINNSGNSSICIGGLSDISYKSCIGIGRKVIINGACSIAIGENSKSYLTSSVALGDNSTTNGIDCVAIGYKSNAISNCSTAIGSMAMVNSNNSVALGYNAQTSNASSIQLGDATYLSSITAKVPITTTSDERDKIDITEFDNKALEFINKIKAIRYVFNGRKLYIDEENLPEEEKDKLHTYGMCEYDREAHAQGTKKGSRIRVGVSAQNIQQALIDVFGDSGYANLVNDNLFDYDPDEIPEGVESQLAVNYEGFIPFLIKAVQELSTKVKELENK